MAKRKYSRKKRKKNKRQDEMLSGSLHLESDTVPEQLPDHHTSRPLRQAQLLQMQQQHGNAHVQRLLTNDTAAQRQEDDAAADT
ncbi:MAG: hypothetical protein GY796_21795, partial [Chloroflexi bacterium]|nr:hypothetical protein [Chloroflexota bacterium]